ncbi:MAG: hypothetical protein AVDCRST_MAG19-3792, partial [uncultured Thermomicrobiales bacterium]
AEQLPERGHRRRGRHDGARRHDLRRHAPPGSPVQQRAGDGGGNDGRQGRDRPRRGRHGGAGREQKERARRPPRLRDRDRDWHPLRAAPAAPRWPPPAGCGDRARPGGDGGERRPDRRQRRLRPPDLGPLRLALRPDPPPRLRPHYGGDGRRDRGRRRGRKDGAV